MSDLRLVESLSWIYKSEYVAYMRNVPALNVP